ncbi:MAG: MFS transporter [Deltaproteobacteria bacterium]|nr:MFS transporter [Deltaproteobacteria bacterium]
MSLATPPGGSPLRARAFPLLLLSLFISSMGLGVVAPLLPIYAYSLGASGLWLGLFFAAFNLSRIAVLPLIGRISDDWGRKRFIAAGLLVFALSSLGLVVARNIQELTFTRLFQGVASAMVMPIAMAYAAELAPQERQGAYMGWLNVALFGGFGFGPMMGGFLQDHLNVQATFYLMGALSLLGFLLVQMRLPDLRLSARIPRDQAIPYHRVLRDPVVLGVSCFRTINAVGRGIVLAFLPLMASAQLRLSTSEIGLLVSVNILTTSAFQGPFGRLADWFSRRALVAVGGLIASLGVLAIPLATLSLHVYVISVILGLASAIALPAATAMIAVSGRSYGMGVVMGLFNLAMSLGLAGGPLLAGALTDFTGLAGAFVFGGGSGLLGVAGFLWLTRGAPARERAEPVGVTVEQEV